VNRISLLFAALVAASFAMAPGNAPETSQPPQKNSTITSRAGSGSAKNNEKESVLPKVQATSFVAGFLKKGSAYGNTSPSYQVLFATVADPVQTHLAAAFDHDVAALQDGVQDSGYLFDSSWIQWDFPQSYDAFDDEVSAEELHQLKQDLPGILLFRKSDAQPGENPYDQGLIVFLLAEKPTAGINITQAANALQVLASASAEGAAAGKTPLALPDPVRIAGPTFSGSFNSFAPLVSAFMNAPGIQPPKRFLVRSGGFTSCSAALSITQSIAQKFKVQVDIGSAAHPFESWNELALRTLQKSGIDRGNVAVLSEGESLFGESARDEDINAPDQADVSANCTVEYTQDTKAASMQPWNLQFPRDISALRSSYEKQGLLDNSTTPETGKRSLHLNSEEARNGDSIRMFGTDETVAAQESVLFGISEFIRSHGIQAVIIVATSEEDSYFLTRFLHANNAGMRVVILGASRLFMRGSTAQFRGDMMVSGFPQLPRLHDWTKVDTVRQDPTYHVFPNDSSAGAYMAVRDLLYGLRTYSIPHEYLRPDWGRHTVDLRQPVYIAALGGGAAWPVSELDDSRGFIASAPAPSEGNNASAPATWRLTMPFAFGTHLRPDNKLQPPPNAGKAHSVAPGIRAARSWELTYWICIAIPVTYCFGIWYADPVRRRWFAYLQPAAHWPQWILLITIPALLSEASFLVLARQMTFPSVLDGDHQVWLTRALVASFTSPLVMMVISFVKALNAGCFAKGNSNFRLTPALPVFILSALAVVAVFFTFIAHKDAEGMKLPDMLRAYREMHWDSGLSLMPTILLIILAIAVWNYEALVGISVLHTCPHLPSFAEHEHISEPEAKKIADAGHPFPVGRRAGMYWLSVALAGLSIVLALLLWPSFRAITTLSDLTVTHRVLALAGLASLLMLLDILQFVWLWTELQDLLQALNSRPFKRSFLALRSFNWSSIWSFSAGSFQERRKVLAAEVSCAIEIIQQSPHVLPDSDINKLKDLLSRYSKIKINVGLAEYRIDLLFTYDFLAKIGTAIAESYAKMLSTLPRLSCASALPSDDNPFRDEELELEQLPPWLCLHERFLCLLYLGFIRIIIARLRTLAISIVLIFSLVGLALAVYPFQPSQPLFISGACALAAIAVVMFVVFSQMDRDPILARILQSNPNKLEWSFYGKFIDALALPLLTLLSTLLPGGAGRLIELLRIALSHAQ
jgi:hypothetical protein